MTRKRSSSLFLAFKQGYASLSNSSFRIFYDRILYDEYFFEREKNLFFENFSFFHVTMKFLRNLPTSTGKWAAGERYVPSSFQMAYFFKIFDTFCRKKNVAQKLQVEKIGIWAENSEEYVKSRVTSDYMLTWKFDCNVFISPRNFLGLRALKILSIQVRLGKTN